ncbi:hypothetical protein AB0A81_31530 [Streptomyces flaveolus]|uniref:ABM domain-containing protein n=1 Tax=Streptomyces flaveolus TaxID=67297 RepID=A0ABV1VJA5_9ACTN
MPAYGFFVEFEAKPDKEEGVAQLLVDAKAKELVDAEPGTLAWFSFRPGACCESAGVATDLAGPIASGFWGGPG